MTREFWQECASLGAVVVAFKAYSQYGTDGNLHEEHFVGIHFGCIDGDNEGVLRDGEIYVAVDDALSRLSEIADSPEAALALFKERKDARRSG